MITKQRKTGITFILLAVLCAVGVGTLVFLAGLKIAPSVPALVAIEEIQAGDPLSMAMFQETKLAKANLPDGIISPKANLNSLMAKHGMVEGDILREANTIDGENFDIPVLSARLKTLKNNNIRGVDIPIEAAAGMLAGMKAGDQVDIISVAPETVGESEKIISKTVIENARVVGISIPGESSTGALVIAATQEEVEVISLAKTKGNIYVSLKPFGKGE